MKRTQTDLQRPAKDELTARTLEKSAILDPRLHAYLLAHEPKEHEELAALRELTSKMPNGNMQITPEQGHLLAFLVRLIGARRILEVGTFTGYSTLAMALAVPADGQIVACDVSEAWTKIGRLHWERAGVAAKIDLRLGPARSTLKELQAEMRGSFDLAFLDADKEAYDDYYEAALVLVRPAGLIVLDNMLWRGRVADPDEMDSDTVAIRHLNSKIAKDERIDHVLLAIASGVTLVRRRS